ncbi:MAG: phosphoenolpyruvate carboxykinase (ATP) [Candidatus Paceibacterota bacterium]|jgi:phosphoenolpyruvate carboxykinase (ATP)
MKETGLKAKNANLKKLKLHNAEVAHWNLKPEELVEKTVKRGEGRVADNGAVVVDTGEFKGRSPKDKFVVYDETTRDSVWWGDVNHKFDENIFESLYERVTAHLSKGEIFVRDAQVCVDPQCRTKVRIITESPWQDLFVHNLFLRPSEEEVLNTEDGDWSVVAAPTFKADPLIDGTRQHNFTIINFAKKIILIGGSAYAGEIKKSVFSVLNYVLPKKHNVLTIHSSANVGKDGDTALFFGLSGTGKTTLSADHSRELIGDDEHGWSDKGVFNFEGGCYAKCVNLSQEHEPQIWNAIKDGAVVENAMFLDGTDTINFADVSKTENTRVAYPIHYIQSAREISEGGIPKNIFFLTCDASGVLPPISKLDIGQAMYHFLSGYTAKVAGTEVGVVEPELVFSACFGKAFLPLHPARYAELLGKKLKEHTDINVWLVNTGWSGGAYGTGQRIKLSFTRAIIRAALDDKLSNVEYDTLPVFNLKFPKTCPDVPKEIMNPRNTWENKAAYDTELDRLARAFNNNFEMYESNISEEILVAAPKPQSA